MPEVIFLKKTANPFTAYEDALLLELHGKKKTPAAMEAVFAARCDNKTIYPRQRESLRGRLILLGKKPHTLSKEEQVEIRRAGQKRMVHARLSGKNDLAKMPEREPAAKGNVLLQATNYLAAKGVHVQRLQDGYYMDGRSVFLADIVREANRRKKAEGAPQFQGCSEWMV